MGEHQQRLQEMDVKIYQLAEALTQVSTQRPTQAATPAPATSVNPLERPEKSVGEPSQCHGLMLQCSLYFNTQEGISQERAITLAERTPASAQTSAMSQNPFLSLQSFILQALITHSGNSSLGPSRSLP